MRHSGYTRYSRKRMKLSVSFISLALLAQSGDSQWVEKLASWWHSDLRQAEERLLTLNAELSTLPPLTQINSSGSIGFKTNFQQDGEELWVEIKLPQAALVDSIILVPPLAKGATGVVSGYGFPTRYRIEAFDETARATTVVDATTEDVPSPGGYPVQAHFKPILTQRLRLTATEPWQRDGPPVLALSEMLVLSGQRNVGLGGAVTSTSSIEYLTSWNRKNIIDLATPLGLPAAPAPATTLGFHSAVSSSANDIKSVTLTLPSTQPLDEVRLIPVRRKEVPLWYDYGFPNRFKIESATSADFSDAQLIFETTSRYPVVYGMNPVCFFAQGKPARYLRITATQLWKRQDDYVFALAEIQALSAGQNIALNASSTASDVLTGDESTIWSLSALTDGLTESGRLIEWPEWYAHMERRRVLEQERNDLSNKRAAWIAATQHQLVYGSITSVGGISLLSILLLWRQWRERRRDALRLQEKLARDLHDEIGSNLGSITLICSIASQPDATQESLKADIADIERVAAETADSMRDMVRLISPRQSDQDTDWIGVLHTLTERLLRGHTLDCALPAAPLTSEPDIATRRELYLFCKEVLHNISRHAQATRVRFHLLPTATGLRIEIRDNGCGFDTTQNASGHGLGNLRERAATIKAHLDIVSKPGEGTAITLDLKRTQRWRRPGT
jgi:signal transduction histidine kinase